MLLILLALAVAAEDTVESVALKQQALATQLTELTTEIHKLK